MRAEEIARLLPEVIQRTLKSRDSPLPGILNAMGGLLTPSEKILEDLDRYFDPLRTEDRFVPLLARWVDMVALLEDGGGESGRGDRFLSGRGRLRELVAGAARLARLRGTTEGLRLFLEIATGFRGFEIIERASLPFHMKIRVPAGAEKYRSLVERIIAREKPAYVTCKWEFKTD